VTTTDARVEAPSAHPAARRRGGRVDVLITRRAFRQVWKGAVVAGAMFGLTVASSALSYVSTFPTEASRQEVAAATSGNAGFAVLLGPTSTIDTPGGYTVYKCFVFLTTVGALWALFAATRLLRGQEDTGRWQLLLAGRTRAPQATGGTTVALYLATLVIGALTAVCTAAAGADSRVGFSVGSSVLYACSIMIAPASFVAIGACVSQLGRTRRVANGLGMAAFGIFFVLRMAADSGPGASWLAWLTPFGWTERMTPLTEPNALPLLPALLFVVGLTAVAVVLAGRRDVGAGVIATRDSAPPRSYGLSSPLGLAARLELGTFVAWIAGTAAAGLVFGLIAEITTKNIPDSMNNMLSNFDVTGTFAREYFGVAFLLFATMAALVPAGQVGAAADEELTKRLVSLLSLPATRRGWLAGRLALATTMVVVVSVVAGVTAWAGAAIEGVEMGFGSMLGAGLNMVPTALVCLGIGAVVLALAPRFAALAVYVVVAWSIIIDFLGSLVTSLSTLDRFSLFHYMALAPAADIDLTAVVVTLVAALVLMVVAVALFARRDLSMT
jgi:ABC-2 type transport system permease protein